MLPNPHNLFKNVGFFMVMIPNELSNITQLGIRLFEICVLYSLFSEMLFSFDNILCLCFFCFCEDVKFVCFVAMLLLGMV